MRYNLIKDFCRRIADSRLNEINCGVFLDISELSVTLTVFAVNYNELIWCLTLYSCNKLFHFFMILEMGSGTLNSRSTTLRMILNFKLSDQRECMILTYAQAYLEAFLLPVNNGDNSARKRMRVFTLSASPVKII